MSKSDLRPKDSEMWEAMSGLERWSDQLCYVLCDSGHVRDGGLGRK